MMLPKLRRKNGLRRKGGGGQPNATNRRNMSATTQHLRGRCGRREEVLETCGQIPRDLQKRDTFPCCSVWNVNRFRTTVRVWGGGGMCIWENGRWPTPLVAPNKLSVPAMIGNVLFTIRMNTALYFSAQRARLAVTMPSKNPTNSKTKT